MPPAQAVDHQGHPCRLAPLPGQTRRTSPGPKRRTLAPRRDLHISRNVDKDGQRPRPPVRRLDKRLEGRSDRVLSLPERVPAGALQNDDRFPPVHTRVHARPDIRRNQEPIDAFQPDVHVLVRSDDHLTDTTQSLGVERHADDERRRPAPAGSALTLGDVYAARRISPPRCPRRSRRGRGRSARRRSLSPWWWRVPDLRRGAAVHAAYASQARVGAPRATARR